MLQSLEYIDNVRLALSPHIARERKAELGQFMTPARIAHFMASLFPANVQQECRLLDAGAGIGTLSCAFLDRCLRGELHFNKIEATSYEIDSEMGKYLKVHLQQYENRNILTRVFLEDYIENATKNGVQNHGYTHVIMNPPYKKIHSQSLYRKNLRKAGIETVNMYSAFLALAIGETAPGGQIVAIIPRSFCNGPYYRPFREFLLEHTAIHHLHLFASRCSAFRIDNVLQENLVIRLEKGGEQGDITVSSSTNDTFSDTEIRNYPFTQIVFPEDNESFIHIPTSCQRNLVEQSVLTCNTLDSLGINVSTGPVVDFRLKDHLRYMPEADTVPLLYPVHFRSGALHWPVTETKKPNAIRQTEVTQKYLYPNGFYCVVRRFSSKEEKRRLVASVIDPMYFNTAQALGLENHLNVFHINKKSLPELIAWGLAMYLNSTAVDKYFRQFSGHTQVNATDLRQMKYPDFQVLTHLGEWYKHNKMASQTEIDSKIEAVLL